MIDVSHSARGELSAGTLIAGRFRVTRLLGRGGMGAVYEAEHVELGRQVALKTVLPQAAQSEDISARLLREARAAARIGHPGIVDVFDLLEHEGTTFVVMERLHGEELHQRIQREGKLTVAFTLRMGIEVSGAIAAAHAHGIIHRDLKPRNVFVARDPRLGEVFKVLDFGIAKLTHDSDMRLATSSGHVVGTPAYMAPERLAGASEVDGRADIYAIGALLYEALTGRPPYEAKSYPELVLRVSSEPPRPIGELRPDVPAELAALIARALSRDPKARHASADALRAELLALEGTSVMQDSGCRPTAPQALLLGQTTATSLHPSAPPERAARKSRWPYALVASLLVAVCGWGAYRLIETRAGGDANVSSRRGGFQTRPQQKGSATGGFETSPYVGAEDQQRRGQSTAVAAVAQVAAAPSTAVRFETTPPGAAVVLDGEHACDTPCTRELSGKDSVAVQLTLKGHLVQRRVLRPPWPERLTVQLVPRRASAQAAAELPGLPPLLPR